MFSIFCMHQAHNHRYFRTPFSVQHFHLEIGNTVIPVIRVLIDATHVRIATVTSNNGVVCSHTHKPTHDGEYAHCSTISTFGQFDAQSLNLTLDHCSVLIVRRCDTFQTDRFSRLHPKNFAEAMVLQGSSCCTTSNVTCESSVARHRSRIFRELPSVVCW